MKKRMTIAGWYLLLMVLLIAGGCGTEPPAPTEETPIVPEAESELANPASVYCEDQGYTLEIRTDEAGGQFGVCVFPDGTECEEWAFFRGTCGSEQAPAGQTAFDVSPLSPVATPAGEEVTEPVEAWIGTMVSNPQGAQFDDYFQMLDQNGSRFGITSSDPLLEQELTTLRDTGQLIQVWGVLRRDVPDAYGAQIEVTRIAEYQ